MYPTTLEWPCIGFRRTGWRLGALAVMAARGRGWPGAPFGRGAGFGRPFFGGQGPFPRGPRARRGDVRAAALLLLADGPLNGYQIMQEIEERSDGVWRPSPGSVYPALAQLEDEGLIRAQQIGDRRTYVLTDAGRTHVDERRDDLGAPWEQMSGFVDEDAGALFRELRRVGMAAAQIGHVGGASQIARARGVLAEARRDLYSLLAEDDGDE